MGYRINDNLNNFNGTLYNFRGDLNKFGLGNSKILIVGLGNPGDEYLKTRHNVGFMMLDKLAGTKDVNFVTKKDLKSQVAVTYFEDKQVILAKPLTFMNLSGDAIQELSRFYKINPSEIIVVHDELDLPIGTFKEKKGGGSAGHNGLKSIIKSLGEDFTRIRIGIGPKNPPDIDSADFVLQKFSSEELSKLESISTSITQTIISKI